MIARASPQRIAGAGAGTGARAHPGGPHDGPLDDTMARVTPHTRRRRIEGEAAIVDPAVTAPAPAPSTSLIISSRDRPVFLEQVVASVLAGDEYPDEVVVIDRAGRPTTT